MVSKLYVKALQQGVTPCGLVSALRVGRVSYKGSGFPPNIQMYKLEDPTSSTQGLTDNVCKLLGTGWSTNICPTSPHRQLWCAGEA